MRSIIAFTVAAMSLVVGAMFVYYRDGGTLVAAQEDTVGEMLLDEGLRFEAGRYNDQAKEKYKQAESARFQGEKNLRHLQLKLGQYVGDTEYFRLASTGNELAKVKPSLWLDAWVGLCDSLAGQRQWEDLAKAVEAWGRAVEDAGPRGVYQTSQDQSLDLSERARFRAMLVGK
jgi:hypothetical protein